jgi:hypothetical protein
MEQVDGGRSPGPDRSAATKKSKLPPALEKGAGEPGRLGGAESSKSQSKTVAMLLERAFTRVRPALFSGIRLSFAFCWSHSIMSSQAAGLSTVDVCAVGADFGPVGLSLPNMVLRYLTVQRRQRSVKACPTHWIC